MSVHFFSNLITVPDLVHFLSLFSQLSNSRSEFVSKQGCLFSLVMMGDLFGFLYSIFYVIYNSLVRLQLQNELFHMI